MKRSLCSCIKRLFWLIKLPDYCHYLASWHLGGTIATAAAFSQFKCIRSAILSTRRPLPALSNIFSSYCEAIWLAQRLSSRHPWQFPSNHGDMAWEPVFDLQSSVFAWRVVVSGKNRVVQEQRDWRTEEISLFPRQLLRAEVTKCFVSRNVLTKSGFLQRHSQEELWWVWQETFLFFLLDSCFSRVNICLCGFQAWPLCDIEMEIFFSRSIIIFPLVYIVST